MNSEILIFDFLRIPTGLAVGMGVSSLFIGTAVSFVIYKLLRRVMRTAFRMAIVAVVMLIALIFGGIFFLFALDKPAGSPVRPAAAANARR